MEVLSEVNVDLAYLSEKLVNLNVLLTHTLAWDDFEEMDGVSEGVLDEYVERALVFDFLSGVLEGEVAELERNMSVLQLKHVDAQQRMCLCKWDGDGDGEMIDIDVVEEKLRASEESWEQLRERILEMKMLSANLQNKNCKGDSSVDIVESPITSNSLIQGGKKRDILRMLEKSLANYLDLETKYLDTREHEDELQVMLRYREQAVLHMEEASEAAWARVLEADSSALVLLGTSKESLSRLQIVQFHLDESLQRETDLKCQLENLLTQLKIKEETVRMLQEQTNGMETGMSCSHEKAKIKMLAFHEKVRSLEEKLRDSEANHKNLELTKELGFSKSTSPNAEKVTLLEKQLRELDIQLQNAKAVAVASQEQQAKSCTAIWEMETLIDDLKSKVSKHRSETERTEEEFIALSKSNIELNKEKNCLMERLELVETSLEEVSSEKLAISADISFRSRLILDMVAQIATERERLEKQVQILVEENKALAHKLQSKSKKVDEQG